MAQEFSAGGSAPNDVTLLDLLKALRAINDNLVIIAGALAPTAKPAPTPAPTMFETSTPAPATLG
jgi:hypothetical protein